MNKLDIFEHYGSNYVGIASFQHYKTAGADVEAALKRWDFSIIGAASTSPIGGGGIFFFFFFFFLIFSEFFKKVKGFKIGPQLFEL